MLNDAIIIELKSVRRIIKALEIQLINALAASGKLVSLVLNVGGRKVETKRNEVWAMDLNKLINRTKKQSSQSCYPVKDS